ncbi:MAG TPA: DNA translocase FtsK 4TM domain-containing protein [Bacillota bacterium]|nr:DNA translocase FtsK 4TM domain-containing protein [Bacillota bacterium]
MKPELRREVAGLIWLCLGVLGIWAAASHGPLAGSLPGLLRNALTALCGRLAVVPPLIALGYGLVLVFPIPREGLGARVSGGVLLTAAADGWLHLRLPAEQAFALAWHGQAGGLVGATLSWPLANLLGRTGAEIALGAMAAIALVMLLQRPLGPIITSAVAFVVAAVGAIGRAVVDFVYVPVGEPQPAAAAAAADGFISLAPEVAPTPRPAEPVAAVLAPALVPAAPEPVFTMHLPSEPEPEPVPEPAHVADESSRRRGAGKPSADAPSAPAQLTLADAGLFQVPPMDLLRKRSVRNKGAGQRDAAARGRALEDALASFGVHAKVVEIAQGPTVTRFELQPGEGVRVNRISALADDIALSLAAVDVRIVAPIPGKSVVGIEVPNVEITPVFLRDVMETGEWRHSASPLTVALGEDITGRPVVSSLDKMVHVLIGGATGSGKSITLNCMLASLLFKARPDELKLVLIDPKMVEMSVYNGIPHLLAPVVTDPKKAAASLRLLIKEMESRYARFAEAGVRHIGSYNEWAADHGAERLPFIVVVIDELADLMLVARADVENSIQRLCQMARAAGMHLVVATQRPSVDVITGVIKANIQTRIALAVASQVDSRTILDVAGAEKLLGRGDMLFHPVGGSKPIRAQGAYISDSELESILGFLRNQGKPQFNAEIAAAEADDEEDEREDAGDALFSSAVRVVAETGQASVSNLQRRLRVGFTRAGRLIDMMEQRGLVGPHQGSKSREVLISMEGYRRMFGDESEELTEPRAKA